MISSALKLVVSSIAILLSALAPAFAGTQVTAPIPLAGLAGPYGLVAAGLVYGGYRVVKRFRGTP
jgi:hypothetical protein